MEMEWISVKDKLPPEDDPVLVVVHGYRGGFEPISLVEISSYSHDFGFSLDDLPIGGVIDITHWMPLPELPKEVHT